MKAQAFYSYFSGYFHANSTCIYLDSPHILKVKICLRTTDGIFDLHVHTTLASNIDLIQLIAGAII